MGPKTKELIQVLNEIISLLNDDDNSHWEKWMISAKTRLINSDYSGIEHLLGAYGGMGSFNDLVIGHSIENSKFQWKPNAKENNDKLNELRHRAYEIADYIKRNHEIE